MENLNKDHQLSPERDTNDISLNPVVDEDQGKQDGGELSGKKPRTSSPSNKDNEPSQNHQHPPNLQWSCTLQPVNEPQQVVATTSIPNFTPSPVMTSQWQPQMQLNGGCGQAQLYQLPPHFVSSNPPGFLLPQRPGYQLQGGHNLGSCQSIPQMGSVDNSWQVSAGSGLVTASRNPGQIPVYQFGYPHATYSAGPWDPSSWWGQVQSPPLCVYPFPGATANHSNPPPVPQPTTNCSSAAVGQSSQKGVIRPSVKISQKHQLLWEAQSAENVQLRSAIAGLQADQAEFRSRLMKLETEIKSLKTSGEQLAAHGTGHNSTGQTTKRGRPKKIVSSVNALPSSDEALPRPRGRRPALSKAPPEIKEINFQKDDKNKVEFIQTISPLTSTPQHANGEKYTSIFTSNSSPIETSSGDPAYQNPNFPSIPQTQRNVVLPNPSSKTKAADKNSQEQVKKLIGDASSANLGVTNNGNNEWPSNVTSGDCGKNITAISHGFYSHGNVSGQGNVGVVPWNTVTDNDNASEDLDEATEESEKEETEKENVASTCHEGISLAKNEVPYDANTPEDGNASGFLSW